MSQKQKKGKHKGLISDFSHLSKKPNVDRHPKKEKYQNVQQQQGKQLYQKYIPETSG